MKNFMLIGVPDFVPTAITDGDGTVAEIFLSSGQVRCIAHFVMFVCRPNGTAGIFPVCGSVTVCTRC